MYPLYSCDLIARSADVTIRRSDVFHPPVTTVSACPIAVLLNAIASVSSALSSITVDSTGDKCGLIFVGIVLEVNGIFFVYIFQ